MEITEQDFAELIQEILIEFVKTAKKDFCGALPLEYIDIGNNSVSYYGGDPRFFKEKCRQAKMRYDCLESGISFLMEAQESLDRWRKDECPVDLGKYPFAFLVSKFNCGLGNVDGEAYNPLAEVIWEALAKRIKKGKAKAQKKKKPA